MAVVVAAVIVVASIVVGLAIRASRRDEVFDGLTPGLLPAPGQPARRRHLRRGEKPTVAVRFNPPDHVGPGLAGVAIDGRVDPVELSATLVDLAGRGWLSLHPLTRDGATKPYDWELRSAAVPPVEPLSATEQVLLGAAFGVAPVITLSAFRTHPALATAADTLTREAADRGWMVARSGLLDWAERNLGLALGAVGFFGLIGFHFGVIGVGLILAGIILIAMNRRLPETLSAEGSAVRSQAEGFKLYLATAEAEQLKFEVGIDVFSRYLPYAMVFGVVDHWRSVFAAAMTTDPNAGLSGMDWLVLDDAMSMVMLFDLLSLDSGIFESLVTDFGGFGDITDLPGADLIGSVGDLFDGIDFDLDL